MMLKLTTMRAALEKNEVDENARILFQWTKTLFDFYIESIQKIADIIKYDANKTEKYVEAAQNMFIYLEKWRFEKSKIVGARKKEMDNAVSFIRNQSLQQKTAPFLIAPVCRNMASVLRACIHVGSFAYSNEQIPTVLAHSLYTIAAVRTFFPMEISNLYIFLPEGTSIHGGNDPQSLDNFHLMVENAGNALSLQAEIRVWYETLEKMWENLKNPFPFEYSDEIWKINSDGRSRNLYYENLKNFHSR